MPTPSFAAPTSACRNANHHNRDRKSGAIRSTFSEMRPQIAGPTLRLLAKPTPGSDMPMPTCCMFNRCDWGPGCRMASNFPADDKIHASDASNARLGEAQTHACKKYLPCGARTRGRDVTLPRRVTEHPEMLLISMALAKKWYRALTNCANGRIDRFYVSVTAHS